MWPRDSASDVLWLTKAALELASSCFRTRSYGKQLWSLHKVAEWLVHPLQSLSEPYTTTM